MGNKIINDSDFKKQIKSAPESGYLFFGDEDYLKCAYVRLASETIVSEPAFSLFNDIKIDYSDYNRDKLLDAITALPMMAERKLITLTGFDFRAMRKEEIDELCEVLAQLPYYDYNTLIINVTSGNIDEGTAKRTSNIMLKLSEFLIPVRFPAYSGPKLEAWVNKHFSSCGVELDIKTLRYFISYCGNNMFRLSSEIEKLGAYVKYHERCNVTEEDIRLVCVATTEYDTFAFANAILEGRDRDALTILGYMKLRRIEPLIIFGELSKIFCDLLIAKRLSDNGMSSADMANEKYFKSSYGAGIYIRTASKLSYDSLYRKLMLCDEADRQLKLSPQGYSVLERLICAG